MCERMYSSKSSKLLYDRGHTVEVEDEKNSVHQKSVNITVNKNSDGSLIVKLRDINCLSFNFTSIISNNQFQLMKKEQSLNIDFDEFETHLFEMFQANSNEEMLLKCVQDDVESKCQLIFYEKSKIKCLIFLVIHMVMTNYKEVLEEVEVNLKSLQETNRNLNQQLSCARRSSKEKDNQIIAYTKLINELEQTFFREIQNVNKVFHYKLGQCKSLFEEKISTISAKIEKLISNINYVKNELHLKSASFRRLEEKFENHKKQHSENISLMNMLKMDFADCKRLKEDLEHQLLQLRESKVNCDKRIINLELQVEEYRRDLENSALIINKKTEEFNELSGDILQAGRIIKDFSKHYDAKAKEVEDLKEVLNAKDNLIKEQIFQNNCLFKEFQEYKSNFNDEKFNKIIEDASSAENKVKALQKENRELLKINGLLSKKLSSTNMLAMVRDDV